MIRVVIIDDHRIFRIAIKNIIQSDDEIQLAGEFDDSSILQSLDTLHPDVVMCDLSLDKESGLDLIKKIRKVYPDLKLLVMSMHKDEFHIIQALEYGANGYLYKGDHPEEVLTGMRSVLKGEQYFSTTIREVFHNQIKNNPNHGTQPFLTKKEKEVVHFIMQGLTSKEIADKMNVSARTVEAHRYNILNKLGFRNTGELIKSIADHKLDFI